MKRIKFVFGILAVAMGLFMTGCLKSNDQITGPVGKTGATGLQGGNLPPLWTNFQLYTAVLTKVGTNQYVYKWGFAPQSRDSNITYMVTASVYKVRATGSNVWHKLPYYGVYNTTDMLSASLKHDTVSITYTSASAFPSAGDSTINGIIYVIAQPANSN